MHVIKTNKPTKKECQNGNKAEYPALDASRRRLREGVTVLRTDLRTDGPTDGRTDTPSYRDVTVHLKSTSSCLSVGPFRFFIFGTRWPVLALVKWYAVQNQNHLQILNFFDKKNKHD